MCVVGGCQKRKSCSPYLTISLYYPRCSSLLSIRASYLRPLIDTHPVFPSRPVFRSSFFVSSCLAFILSCILCSLIPQFVLLLTLRLESFGLSLVVHRRLACI